MDMISALLYGIVQGLTEFLPISSSAHLALLPHLLKIEDPGVGFDLMMHIGTTAAVICYFYKRLWRLCLQIPRCLNMDKTPMSPENEKDVVYLRNLILGTFFTFMLIFIFKNVAFKYGRDPLFMALNSLVFGVLMLIADRVGGNSRGTEKVMETDLRPKKSILIGIFQAIAIFPGVSRSGATITISRFLGLSREEAADFSFLLSIPVIVAATFAKTIEFVTQFMIAPASAPQTGVAPMLLGITISFLVGLATIHYFLKWVKQVGLLYFSIYRCIFALILFAVFWK